MPNHNELSPVMYYERDAKTMWFGFSKAALKGLGRMEAAQVAVSDFAEIQDESFEIIKFVFFSGKNKAECITKLQSRFPSAPTDWQRHDHA